MGTELFLVKTKCFSSVLRGGGPSSGMLTFPQASLLGKEKSGHFQKGSCPSGQRPRTVQAGPRSLPGTGSLHRAANSMVPSCLLPLCRSPCGMHIGHPSPLGLRAQWEVWGKQSSPTSPPKGRAPPRFHCGLGSVFCCPASQRCHPTALSPGVPHTFLTASGDANLAEDKADFQAWHRLARP